MVDIMPVKVLLGMELTDETQDTLLQLLKKNAQTLIRLEIKASTFPDDLDFIADELTVKRYNKISSEGYKNETISSRNVTFESDMLDEYRVYIDKWLAMHPEEGDGNRLVML